MWSIEQELLSAGHVCLVRLRYGNRIASFDEVIRAWTGDVTGRQFFLEILAGLPFGAYRFETPPVTKQSMERAFEFAAVDAPELDRAADPSAFAGQFRSAAPTQNVISIPNLGGDAVLIVPTTAAPAAACAHLAAFVRGAPDPLRHELLQAIGTATLAQLRAEPIWLSTAGMGVPWLHVRLDSRPKYYAYRPYTRSA